MPSQSSKAATAGANTDAIELLLADHRNVEKLFKQYEKLVEDEGSYNEKEALAATICAELTVHMQIEEEIFYPAARDILDEEDLVDEAVVEHASAKDLIAQLSDMSPDDDLYDAKIKVLSELIEHHVEEEEDEMFPKLKKAQARHSNAWLANGGAESRNWSKSWASVPKITSEIAPE